MKYMGIDYGTKRIGVAVSNDDGTVAFPLATVAAGPAALSEVDALIKENGVGRIVLGESRNFAGGANTVQEDIEQFKKDLEALTGLLVVYEQEFLTSAMAGRQGQGKPLRQAESRGQKGGSEKSDASAAALILQSYLERIKKQWNRLA